MSFLRRLFYGLPAVCLRFAHHHLSNRVDMEPERQAQVVRTRLSAGVGPEALQHWWLQARRKKEAAVSSFGTALTAGFRGMTCAPGPKESVLSVLLKTILKRTPSKNDTPKRKSTKRAAPPLYFQKNELVALYEPVFIEQK